DPVHPSSVPVLSPSLIHHATVPLPTSPLFLEATQSADALDETDLPRWEKEPPYAYAEPDSTTEEETFTCHLVDVMLGWRVRLLNEAKAQRRRRFGNGDHKIIFDELVYDIKEQMVRWMTIYDSIGDGTSRGHNSRMAVCWLQWQAWNIYGSTQEALELEKGGNPYNDSS
ncbi:hypothetical protein SCLCIDRAFT_140532, partial [Scleroderma citrinum Foug A]